MNKSSKSYLLIVTLLLSFPAFLLAQSSAFPRKNEIGLGLRTSFNTQSNIGGREIIFKHWFKPWQAYRLSIGHENYYRLHSSDYHSKGDTLYKKSKSDHLNLFFAGGGIEAHRHFYKRVYLLAGLDTRFMYGKGHVEDNIYRYPHDSIVTQHSEIINVSNSKSPISKFQWELKPSIGAKLVFSRYTIGIETFPMNISYEVNKNKATNSSYNLFDLDIGGNRSHRIFFLYRFKDFIRLKKNIP